MKDGTTNPRTLEDFLTFAGIPQDQDEAEEAMKKIMHALRAARTDTQLLAEAMDNAESVDSSAGFMGEVAQLVSTAYRLGYAKATEDGFHAIRQKAAEFTQI